MEQQKVTQYKFKDAGQIFLWAIIMPQIMSFIFIFILSSIASTFKIEYTVAVNHIITQIISLFIIQIGFLILYFLHGKIKKIDFKKAARLNKKISIKQGVILVAIALLSLILFSPLVNFIDYLISLTGYSASGELPIDLTTVGGFIIGVLGLAVAPAICEELIFRGIIYSGLEHKFGYKKAIIFSALLFALMHTSIQQTAYQFIIGVMLGYAFYFTGSLLAPIVLHFSNNFIIVVLNSIVAKDASVVDPNIKPFSTVDEYLSLIYMTVIGVFVLVKLFELLKAVSQKENEKQISAIKVEENEINLIEQNSTQSAINLEAQENSSTQNMETVEDVVLETIEAVESEQVTEDKIAEELKKVTIQKLEDKVARKLLTAGVIMGILFWLFDFVFYLS